LRRGATLVFWKSKGAQSVVRDALMREVRRSPDIVCRHSDYQKLFDYERTQSDDESSWNSSVLWG
jgi:hypothetical protein